MGLFGSSGTRGLVGSEITPAFVEHLAAVAATYWDVPRVAIGRDTRLTGRMLENAAVSGITSVGIDVDRVGILPTPALQGYLEREGIPGCMISASHNPPEYNGMKLFDAVGVELGGETLAEIEAAYETERRHRAGWDHIGTDRTVDGARRDYVTGTLDALDVRRIREAGLTVAVDPGHGAGVHTTQRLCRELGCDVVGVNDTPDGRFPGRAPEPVPEALADLSRLVRASDADLGVAHDGDADRAMFVDERGDVVEGDTSLAIFADALVEAGDTVVSAINASQRLVDVVDRRDATLELTRIGSSNIVERIRECRASGDRIPLAGEGNGGVFFPEYSLARDGAYALGRMLELVIDRPLGERAADHSAYHLVRTEVEYESTRARNHMLQSVAEYGQSADIPVDDTDGYRLEFPDGWALVRASGTEPLIRIVAEAADRATAETYADRCLDVLERA